jgi:hypothetical protein
MAKKLLPGCTVASAENEIPKRALALTESDEPKTDESDPQILKAYLPEHSHVWIRLVRSMHRNV